MRGSPLRHSACGLRLIEGEGKKEAEKLSSRDAVARVLMEAGANLLLRRISIERAEHIERCVNRALALFDLAETQPEQLSKLQAQLEELELLVQESREQKRPLRYLKKNKNRPL